MNLMHLGGMKLYSKLVSAGCVAALVGAFFIHGIHAQNQQKTENPSMNQETQKIVLGGGCFWCVEAVYQRIPGVTGVRSGYAGGAVPNPTYEQVSSGRSGHAEVVEVEYDPAQTSLEKILDVFWDAHNPTTLNRQGADVGTQYRSTIMFADEQQRRTAEASKASAQKKFSDKIVTEIVPLQTFYVAEDYHQDYYNQNKSAGYCRVVIRPKLDKLKLKD
ncbi:peptide-methionine (S)-S-oxide reductase MsrA [Oscillatoria laete-virens NRMC-F 0139]|nr:peptide-methionine (S)-S-oxide reductase MsrA [Oscillatoria laete-virens]MDL5055234.1 peptide-methionine (S)-S-oxide reductase MsrA [Oscillatoria laete-virens NRMC-F 0139]